jgi:hypothetical protein
VPSQPAVLRGANRTRNMHPPEDGSGQQSPRQHGGGDLKTSYAARERVMSANGKSGVFGTLWQFLTIRDAATPVKPATKA